MTFLDLARRMRAESPAPATVTIPFPRPAPDAEPLAPPAPRALPEPPRRDGEPVLIDRSTLDPMPDAPAAEVDRDWRASIARARERFGAHGGAPGGRDAHKFIRDAATLECLLLSREREFTAWRARWRACLEGVYAGKVALLPGFERDLLAAWRTKASSEAE